MKDRIIKYLAAIPIVGLALVFPSNISVPIAYNSTFWFWLVLVSGFLGIAFMYSNANVWLKALLVYCFINSFLSQAPYLSFTIYISVVFSFYFFLLCLKIKDYEFIFRVVQAIFLLNIILIVNQFFNADTLLNFNRVADKTICFGNIGNPMVFGTFVVTLAPFLLAYSKWNIVPLFALAIRAKSIGAIMSLGLGVLCYLLFYLRIKMRFKVLIVVIAMVLSVFFGRTTRQYQYFNTHRLLVWKKTIELTRQYPLQGWGIGTFKVIFPALTGGMGYKSAYVWHYEGTSGDRMAWRQAHNCWVQLLFEIGIAGMTLLFLYLLYLFLLFAKAHKTNQVIVAMASAIILMFNMLLHFPTRLPQSVLIIICFIAYFKNLMLKERKCLI